MWRLEETADSVWGGSIRNSRSRLSRSTTEPAKIRGFFIHPLHARKEIARAILEAFETEATAVGFKSLELMSTLPGIKLYRHVVMKETNALSLQWAMG